MKNTKQLRIDIDEQLHRHLKYQALKRNISLKKWVLRALNDYLKKEMVDKESNYEEMVEESQIH